AALASASAHASALPTPACAVPVLSPAAMPAGSRSRTAAQGAPALPAGDAPGAVPAALRPGGAAEGAGPLPGPVPYVPFRGGAGAGPGAPRRGGAAAEAGPPPGPVPYVPFRGGPYLYVPVTVPVMARHRAPVTS